MKQTTVWVLIILVLAAAAAWFLNARQPVTGDLLIEPKPPIKMERRPRPNKPGGSRGNDNRGRDNRNRDNRRRN